MGYITTEIKSYTYALFPQSDTAKLYLLNAGGIAFGAVFFRPDTEVLPAPFIDGEGKYRISLHRAYLRDMVDMLRNEKPVFFNYWEGGGPNSHFGTQAEPVGDGE
jgi:hypothetical protein